MDHQTPWPREVFAAKPEAKEEEGAEQQAESTRHEVSDAGRLRRALLHRHRSLGRWGVHFRDILVGHFPAFWG